MCVFVPKDSQGDEKTQAPKKLKGTFHPKIHGIFGDREANLAPVVLRSYPVRFAWLLPVPARGVDLDVLNEKNKTQKNS